MNFLKDNINEKTLMASIIFLIINILFLITHFTWWGCIPVLALAFYYYLKKGHLRKENPEQLVQGIAAWIGMYLGSTILTMLVISALYAGFLPTGSSVVAKGLAGDIIFIVVVYVGGLILTKILNQNLVLRLVRHVALLLATYLILHWTMGFRLSEVIYGLIAVMVISLVIEYCVFEYNERNSVIFYRFLLNVFLFVGILGIFQSVYLYQLVNNCVYSLGMWDGRTLIDTIQNGASSTSPFVITDKIPSGILIIGILLFSAGGAFSFIRRTRPLERSEIDVRVYTSLATFLFLILVLRSHSTVNNLVFFFFYIISVFLGLGLDREPVYVLSSYQTKPIDLNNIQYIVESIIVILSPIAYFHSSFIKFICLAALPMGMFQFWRRNIAAGEKTIVFWKNRGFWFYLLCVSAVYAAVSIWEGKGELRYYILIAVIMLIVIAGYVISNLQNPFMLKNRIATVIVITVLAMLVFLFKIGRFSSFGVEVKHTADVSIEYIEQLEVKYEPGWISTP